MATNANVARSVLTPAISTMIADGDISGFESTQIANLCAFSPIYGDVSRSDLDGMIEEVLEDIVNQGHPETIRRAGAALSPALRETALCFAMRIAMADGSINEDERETLVQTAEQLAIDPAIFDQILDVVTMMQRPAAAA